MFQIPRKLKLNFSVADEVYSENIPDHIYQNYVCNPTSFIFESRSEFFHCLKLV